LFIIRSIEELVPRLFNTAARSNRSSGSTPDGRSRFKDSKFKVKTHTWRKFYVEDFWECATAVVACTEFLQRALLDERWSKAMA